MGKMDKFWRWSPIAAGILLIASFVAQAFGLAEVSKVVATILSFVPAGDSPITSEDIAALSAGVTGVVGLSIGIYRKFVSAIAKAKAGGK